MYEDIHMDIYTHYIYNTHRCEYAALYMHIYENTCKYTYDIYKYKYIFFTQVCIPH